jgi:hypothetical protein
MFVRGLPILSDPLPEGIDYPPESRVVVRKAMDILSDFAKELPHYQGKEHPFCNTSEEAKILNKNTKRNQTFSKLPSNLGLLIHPLVAHLNLMRQPLKTGPSASLSAHFPACLGLHYGIFYISLITACVLFMKRKDPRPNRKILKPSGSYPN